MGPTAAGQPLRTAAGRGRGRTVLTRAQLKRLPDESHTHAGEISVSTIVVGGKHRTLLRLNL